MRAMYGCDGYQKERKRKVVGRQEQPLGTPRIDTRIQRQRYLLSTRTMCLLVQAPLVVAGQARELLHSSATKLT